MRVILGQGLVCVSLVIDWPPWVGVERSSRVIFAPETVRPEVTTPAANGPRGGRRAGMGGGLDALQ